LTTSIFEEVSALLTATLKDETGVVIPGTTLEVLMISVYAKGSTDTLLRSSDDALADPNISVSALGVLTWNIQPYETRFVDRTIELGANNDREVHEAVFEAAWASADDGTLTDPFSTLVGSEYVTVEQAGHGHSVNDHAYFVPTTATIGGLDMGGLYIVSEIVDGDTFKVRHRSTATSSESGGGSTEFYSRGKAGKFTAKMVIKRVDPV
jgi:hypothetical protein